MVRVRYFAAAADAADTPEEAVDAATFGELRGVMVARHGAAFASVLEQCSVLMAGERLVGDAAIPEGVVVDVLPPFAGG